MNNKIKFIINTGIITIIIIAAIILLSQIKGTEFIINIQLLWVVFVIYLLVHYAYCNIIRIIFNKIMTKYNNDVINHFQALTELKKINFFYLPPRIKREFDKSIEVIEKLKTIEEGISNIKIK